MVSAGGLDYNLSDISEHVCKISAPEMGGLSPLRKFGGVGQLETVSFIDQFAHIITTQSPAH